ncbi:MAG: VWA domain-containing protein [Myxococcales bacterium]|nr:VWA domain-containing protein [Myxococcales bacterium]
MKHTITTRIAPVALSLVLAGACVSERDVSNKACPCAPGWRCCIDNDVCVAQGTKCPDGSGPLDADELVIAGKVCTSTAAELEHPVKVLLAIDTSGSMQFTDPSGANTVVNPVTGSSSSASAACVATCSAANSGADCASLCGGTEQPRRQAAAAALINKLKANPAVSFAVVRFNNTVLVNGGAQKPVGFTRDDNVLQAALASLTLADGQTDYQGALSKAAELLENDMKQLSASDRARTRYVVMFFSDGLPAPSCQSGCDNDQSPFGLEMICDAERSTWCDVLSTPGPACDYVKSWFPALERCKDYNQLPQLRLIAADIADLENRYGVGGVTLNSTLLLPPKALPKEIAAILKLPAASSDKSCKTGADCVASGEYCVADPNASNQLRCKSELENLLISIASAGGGSYGRYDASKDVDFLVFDYSSLFKPFSMTQLLASNINVRVSGAGADAVLAIDSDGDGVTDDMEAKLGTDPNSADSDGDGYGDWLAIWRDPATGKALATPYPDCPAADRVDLDGDGLNACEERLLGTDPRLADTDRDRVPDGLEVRWGTDPLVVDDKDDPDFDGVLSGEEIRQHTNPRVDDRSAHSRLAYHYSVKQLPDSGDRKCFDLEVRGIRLRPTASGADNHILVTFGEAPSDVPQDYGNFKIACVRARASGKVTLEDKDFVSAAKRGATPGESCKDAPAP